MLPGSSSAALLANTLMFSRGILANPELAFPINSQVPPVAYVSQAYSYSFSSTTFQSTTGSISYSLRNAPEWLSVAETSRLLSGAPKVDDLGSTTFELVAQDDNGETSSTVTLVVREKAQLTISQSILPDLQAVGTVSTPSSLLLYPLSPFSIVFSNELFSGTSLQTVYYATSGDSSPLPPWINFDSKSLSMSGTSPPLVSPGATQQKYELRLVASDVVGFAEATTTFTIAISYHILGFSAASHTVSVTPLMPFELKSYRNELMLDGNEITGNDLVSATSNAPSWAQFNEKEITLSGTPPLGFSTADILIQVEDVYSNMANLSILLVEDDQTIPGSGQSFNITAYIGKDFAYFVGDLSPSENESQIITRPPDAQAWIRFSARNATLYGHVPVVLEPEAVLVTIYVVANGSNSTMKGSINIEQSPRTDNWTSAISSSSTATVPATGSPTSSGLINSQTRTGISKRRLAVVVVSVLLPVFAIVVVIYLLCWRRRRNVKSSQAMDAADDLSRPTEAEFSEVFSQTEEVHVGRSVEPSISKVTMSEDVPQVVLPWAPDSLQKAKLRLSKRPRITSQGSLSSAWEDYITKHSVTPRKQIVASPTVKRHGQLQDHDDQTVQVLTSEPTQTTLPTLGSPLDRWKRDGMSIHQSSATSAVPGLPRRSIGAVGHGMGILPRENTLGRSSWQTTFTSLLLAEPRRETVELDSFPKPPITSLYEEDREATTTSIKPTLRIVQSDSNHSIGFERRRQQWHTQRAREKLEGAARFSNASSARHPSASKLLSLTAMPPNRRISGNIPEQAALEFTDLEKSRSGLAYIDSARQIGAHTQSYVRRDHSTASSGQFDSALSSDSQWEDDGLVAEKSDATKDHDQSEDKPKVSSYREPLNAIQNSQVKARTGPGDQSTATSKPGFAVPKRRSTTHQDHGVQETTRSREDSVRFL